MAARKHDETPAGGARQLGGACLPHLRELAPFGLRERPDAECRLERQHGDVDPRPVESCYSHLAVLRREVDLERAFDQLEPPALQARRCLPPPQRVDERPWPEVLVDVDPWHQKRPSRTRSTTGSRS